MVHSFPLRILTDRGSSFINEFFKTLTTLMTVKHLKTAPFHPQCNAAAEIRHRHLGHALRTYVKPDTLHWHQLLPLIQFAHNCLEMPGMNVSPFQVVYNIPPRLPTDVDIINKTITTTTSNFADNYLPRFDILREVIRQNIMDERRRQKYYFDRKSRPVDVRKTILCINCVRPTPQALKPTCRQSYGKGTMDHIVSSLL